MHDDRPASPAARRRKSRRQKHDTAYRRLFSQPEMVRDLLRGYVHQDFVKDLDFSTLERYPGDHITARLDRRDADVIWRLKLRDGRRDDDAFLYVFVLIEFQSRVDPFMALRVLVYMALLYQELLKDRSLRQAILDGTTRLPPVLPIVLYNGSRPWNAPRQVADLIEALPGLEAHRPHFEFLLLEERKLAEAVEENPGEERPATLLENLVAVLFALERASSPEEIDTQVARLESLLAAATEGHDSLKEAFTAFMTQSLLPGRFADADIPSVKNLEEIRPMLKENFRNWTQRTRHFALEEGWHRGMERGLEKGRQQGRLEGQIAGRLEGQIAGRLEGVRQGQAALLLRLLEGRFGPLEPLRRQQVETADSDRLQLWGERFGRATCLEDVLESTD